MHGEQKGPASGLRANASHGQSWPLETAPVTGQDGAFTSHAESARLHEAGAGGHCYSWVQEMVKSNEEPGALVCAKTAEILQVNEKFASIFGYTAEKMLEQKIGLFCTGKFTETLQLKQVTDAILSHENYCSSAILMYRANSRGEGNVMKIQLEVVAHFAPGMPSIPRRNVLLKARCLSTRVSDAILEYAEAKNKFEKQQPSVVSPRVEVGGSAGREDRAAGLRRTLQQEAGLKPENQWKRVVIGQKGSDKPLSRSIVAGKIDGPLLPPMEPSTYSVLPPVSAGSHTDHKAQLIKIPL